MKCSALRNIKLEEYCPNEAKYILSNKPHWENQPYCESCTYWIMNGPFSYVYVDKIDISVVATESAERMYAEPGGRLTGIDWLDEAYADYAEATEEAVKRLEAKCAYCAAEWHASKFHPGSCGECGGPR